MCLAGEFVVFDAGVVLSAAAALWLSQTGMFAAEQPLSGLVQDPLLSLAGRENSRPLNSHNTAHQKFALKCKTKCARGFA